MAGERGAEMVDMLKKNPAVAVEIVLARLQQKIEEWQSDKRKMTDIWQKIYNANYHKSLDHRSFYFKQVSLFVYCFSAQQEHVKTNSQACHCELFLSRFVLLQTDKRNLGQKTMLQEIKDAAEKRRTDDKITSFPQVPLAARLTPELTYGHKDK